MTKKYEFVSDDTNVLPDGTTLTRIRALVDIPPSGVCAGDLGGYIEQEGNLAHEGNCWVSDNALVSGNAWVSDNAKVSGDAWVSGYACVYGDAYVFGGAYVFGDAWVYDNALVYGDARVFGSAEVSGDALVYGDAWVGGYALVTSDVGVLEQTKAVPQLYTAGQVMTAMQVKMCDLRHNSDIRHLKGVSEKTLHAWPNIINFI